MENKDNSLYSEFSVGNMLPVVKPTGEPLTKQTSTEDDIEETSRSELPDDIFGVSAKRKFPLDTKDHVKSAIRFFNYVDKEDEEELTQKLIAKIEEYGLDVTIGEKNRLKNYMEGAIEESVASYRAELTKAFTDVVKSDKFFLDHIKIHVMLHETKKKEKWLLMGTINGLDNYRELCSKLSEKVKVNGQNVKFSSCYLPGDVYVFTVLPDNVEESVMQESWVIPKDDIQFNISEFKPGVPLYITGASGDGKTTWANYLGDQMKAIVCHTDVCLLRVCKTKEFIDKAISAGGMRKYDTQISELDLEFLKDHPDLPYELATKVPTFKNHPLRHTAEITGYITQWPEWDVIEPYVMEYFHYIEEKAVKDPKYKNRYIIIEGCDITHLGAEYFIRGKRPLIVCGGSRLRSLFRRVKRDVNEGDRSVFESILRELKKYNTNHRKLDNNKEELYNGIAKAMKEDVEDEPLVDNRAQVYLIRDIHPQSILSALKYIGYDTKGSVACKVHSGEDGNINYLKPEFWKPIIDSVHGTVVECNTAYEGARSTTAKHIELMKKHKWSDYFKVDIMDAEGDKWVAIPNGRYLTRTYIGKNLMNYNSLLVLSHFKGHAMGGFGGALKQLSIGCASARGKRIIHGFGNEYEGQKILKNFTGKDSDVKQTEQYRFTTAMAEAASSVAKLFEGRALYINVLANISVDCDCAANAHPPCMKDIGVLISTDPVAIDLASVNLVQASDDPGKMQIMQRINSRQGMNIFNTCQALGFGNQSYHLSDITEEVARDMESLDMNWEIGVRPAFYIP